MPENSTGLPAGEDLFSAAVSDSLLESSLRGAAVYVHAVLTRQIDPLTQDAAVQVEIVSGLAESAADPVLDTLRAVVGSIKTGASIDPATREQVSKLISGQEERADLIRNLLLTHQYDRLVRYATLRDRVERVMLSCANRGDLTPAEALAFLKVAIDETNTISGEVRAGATNVNDVMGMLNKVDFAVQESERSLASKFANTTPQGREIVRRLATKLLKATRPEKSTVRD